MEKFCVFCGKKPEDKTKEHIIPRWLIEYTGKLNRNINLGFDLNKRIPRSFAFGQMTLPACSECNNRFSELEAKAKNIVVDIIEKDKLAYENISILLDWFDKVRVGLWLLYHVLNDNFMNIGPNFHIADRMGRWDRMLIIYRTVEDSVRINFTGADTFSFQLLPSCFTLRVNQYYFFNVSKEFLFSRRIGFPFPTNREYFSDNSDKTFMDINAGLGRRIMPLIRGADFLSGVEIYQPMFNMFNDDDKVVIYDNDYVKKNCLNWDKGIGLPFIINQGKNILDSGINEPLVIDISESANKVDPVTFRNLMNIQTYTFQNKLFTLGKPSYKDISPSIKKEWEEKEKEAISYNDFIMKLLQEGLIL